MKLVLLSGGSGKRLWPLSNDSRSKQFLKVLKNHKGQLESMVQRVWRQLEQAGLSNSAIVATSKSQVDMMQSQIGNEVTLVVEPERRDTFPAIALSAVYLYSVKGVSPNEIITVLPVDPFVETSFFEKIKGLENILQGSQADLALLGVTPTYPSEKYGYIIPHNETENKNDSYKFVSHFKEKPSENEAINLIEQKALWNCGVFAFKLEYIITLLMKKGLPVHYDELLKKYHLLPKISFDYEVVEKTSHIVVSHYNGIWKDLGTWNTLTEEMGTDVIGKAKVSEDCSNTHIINELDLPIAVLGISDTVVAASPDGILITSKDASHRVKEMNDIFTERPMYEERHWGWYRVLDYTKYDKREVLTRRICLIQGKNLSYQYHLQRAEIWTILEGEGELVVNGVLRRISRGDVVQIYPRDKHTVRALTNLEFIEVQSGEQLVEEDIIRSTLTWTELMQELSINGGRL